MPEPRTAPAHVNDHSYPSTIQAEANPSVLVDVWPDAAPRIDLTELMRMYRLEGAAQLEALAEWL